MQNPLFGNNFTFSMGLYGIIYVLWPSDFLKIDDFWRLWVAQDPPKCYGVVSKGKTWPRNRKWVSFDEKMMRKWIFGPKMRPPRNLKYSQKAWNFDDFRWFLKIVKAEQQSKCHGMVSKGKIRRRIQKWANFDEEMMGKWVFRLLTRPPRHLKYSQNCDDFDDFWWFLRFLRWCRGMVVGCRLVLRVNWGALSY